MRVWLPLALALAACGNGPLMSPGADCLSCHSRGGGAHPYSVAGTVFAQPDSPDFDGIADAQVTVTDVQGKILTLRTNAAGNFYTDENVVLPIDVVVQVGSERRHMEPRVSNASCGSCHKATPYAGAEGRVFVGTNLNID